MATVTLLRSLEQCWDAIRTIPVTLGVVKKAQAIWLRGLLSRQNASAACIHNATFRGKCVCGLVWSTVSDSQFDNSEIQKVAKLSLLLYVVAQSHDTTTLFTSSYIKLDKLLYCLHSSLSLSNTSNINLI